MKKLDISVTKRDRDLLIILIAFIVGLVFFNYIILPQIGQRTLLKADELAAQGRLDAAYALIDSKEELVAQEASKKKEISAKYSLFYYDLNQARILNQFDTLIQQAGIKVTSYSPSKSAVASVSLPKSKYTYSKYPLLSYATAANPSLLSSITDKGIATTTKTSSSSNTSTADQQIPSIVLTMNFQNSSYSSVISFMKKIEALNKSIVVNKLNLAKDAAGISGQLVVTVYSMPKVDESESTYLQFAPSSGYGKADPFQ